MWLKSTSNTPVAILRCTLPLKIPKSRFPSLGSTMLPDDFVTTESWRIWGLSRISVTVFLSTAVILRVPYDPFHANWAHSRLNTCGNASTTLCWAETEMMIPPELHLIIVQTTSICYTGCSRFCILILPCARGGIGRRARLRAWWPIRSWWFESTRAHYFRVIC